jgi:hypothetical protein
MWRFRGRADGVVPVAGTSGLPIFVREVHPEFLRPFSASDVGEVLGSVPARFLAGLVGVHLLGGSQKQAKAASSALFHYGCYGRGRICLHPFPRRLMTWRIRSLPKPDVMREYERFGAKYEGRPGNYTLSFSKASLTRFYLYDVLLHEIGHHVDHRPRGRDRRESESFANWFAAEQARHLASESSGEATA